MRVAVHAEHGELVETVLEERQRVSKEALDEMDRRVQHLTQAVAPKNAAHLLGAEDEWASVEMMRGKGVRRWLNAMWADNLDARQP